MQEYALTAVLPGTALDAAVDTLLQGEGICRDAHLDYTCALLDEDGAPVATGSCFGNTLRCFAVQADHRGEGLMNQLITHLLGVQLERGNLQVFVYTKQEAARFFADVGFYEIAGVPAGADGPGTPGVSFLENRRRGFESYLKRLRQESAAVLSGPVPAAQDAAPAPAVQSAEPQTAAEPGPAAALPVGAVVMNANPFTRGHLQLVETAAAACSAVHVFVVSEDASAVPFAVRRQLVHEGLAHLSNVCLHETGPYLISAATFPSYFFKEAAAVSSGHARLDAAVFARIAAALGITCRYLGEEPTSRVTAQYNRVLTEALPAAGIRCRVLPRAKAGEEVISASTVRRLLAAGEYAALRPLLPPTTLAFFESPAAAPILQHLRETGAPAHH